MEIRLARPDDAAGVAAIYNHAVATSTAVFDLVPRTLSEQQAWLAHRSGAHAVLVAVDGDVSEGDVSDGGDSEGGVSDGDEIVGFASLSPYRDRPAYNTTVETSVYVRADQQGRGIGRQLMQRLVAQATDHGFHAAMARVVDGNEASIAVHRAVGFEVVGREKEVGRKFNRWLDVVVMERFLS